MPHLDIITLFSWFVCLFLTTFFFFSSLFVLVISSLRRKLLTFENLICLNIFLWRDAHTGFCQDELVVLILCKLLQCFKECVRWIYLHKIWDRFLIYCICKLERIILPKERPWDRALREKNKIYVVFIQMWPMNHPHENILGTCKDATSGVKVKATKSEC